MSFIRQLWHRLKRPTHFVGRDLEGNKFYEYPSTSDDPKKTKRVVKYKQGSDMWEYVASGRRLAVQWTSWLTHTRPHPPTLEEIYADIERRRNLQLRVAMIEARDREDRARQKQLMAASSGPSEALPSPSRSAPSSNIQVESSPTKHVLHDGRETASPAVSDLKPAATDPWKNAQSSDEPVSWSPRTIRRA